MYCNSIPVESKSINYQEENKFYSDSMFVTKKFLNDNHLKLTYQRQLISNLEIKHKEWAKVFSNLK